MNEKRHFYRYNCQIKSKFEYCEGNPATEEYGDPIKGKGRILDISQGGIFIATDEKVSISLPIEVNFKTNNKKYLKNGNIIRTGLIKNNPSETVQKYNELKIKEQSYLAIQFDEPLGFISPDEIN